MPCDLQVDTEAIRRCCQMLDQLATVVRAGGSLPSPSPPSLGGTTGSAPVRQATRDTVSLALIATELVVAVGDHIAEAGAKLGSAAAAFDRAEELCAGGG